MTAQGGDPFGGPGDLPEELRALLEQLGGADAVRRAWAMVNAPQAGPVNWQLAQQVALQLAADGDRAPTPDERRRAEDAQQLAEHWLDEGGLPAPPDAGRLAVVNRQGWVNAALEGLRPLVEPVAEASVSALGDLLDGDQVGDLGVLLDGAADLGGLLRPMGALLTGLQSGQVVGQLARQLLGQYDLGIPTAETATAYRLSVNVAATFDGYGLDPTEVEVVLALQEGAHRRQYHAVPWLVGHLRALIASFAAGTSIDPDQLLSTSRDLMADVDPEDPESLRRAVERAGQVRLEPTAEQRRVLERIQGVVCLLQAWARREVLEAASGRIPDLGRIDEVLRRRRAEQGDGEKLLASLLGLDLKPDDDTVGDRFIETVQDARGLAGLRRALGHPENLPDADELADPSRWLVRMASGEDVPDDASALFEDDGDAPEEPPGDRRGG